MKGVVGRLKQGNRLADVLKRGTLSAFGVSESRDRPVEPDAHVRICGLADALERASHDFLRASDLAHVAQRVTEKRRITRFDRRVTSGAHDAVETTLEELSRTFGLP
jgi:hypothetical protein